ncbi:MULTISPECIES: ABC transporter permease [unclassified Streptomyces]|uniref:FtsX-like permease family protein n=1 Tax=unclassified Streptomyces TaxID=2593676 RepID=UPI000DC7E92F|nr:MULTISPECIES: ABC transporter permease [unclassified Streptomyces]AWZ06210.1 ABC transporter permease [Streptomyces sp. ICC4]AWZ11527.1 ABC transporter permease [Streptomyces sp. ICC1]
MISSYHSWIAAIRIARRDAWRSKGRSSLVLAMIALPIVGVSAVDLTVRSSQLSPEQRVERVLGAADAKVTDSEMGAAIYQSPDAQSYAPVGGYDKYERSAGGNRDELAKPTPELPAGAQSVKDSKSYGKVRTRFGILETELRETDAANPLVKGLWTLERGRLPQAAGEILATTAFLEESGYFVGSSVTPRESTTSYKIVGAYELPDALNQPQLLAPPGTLLAPLDRDLKAAGGQGLRAQDSHLVKVGGAGFTWDMVKQANAKQLLIESRVVLINPPADSEVPLYTEQPGDRWNPGGFVSATELAILSTVVGLAMLEICLLAGPAFAVGARRSRRQLGLVGANGGDRRHIRAIVLSGGLVIGAAAAVTGTVIGVALTIGLRPVLEDTIGQRFGGFDVRPLELLAIGLLAVLTGLLAAIVPAVNASRQTVLASLTGRRGVRRANRVLPVLGLLAIAGGAAIALFGSVSKMGSTVVAGGSAIAELGVVALTPTLVGMFGRAGRWLPLSPRLALRDAVRNRGRTAPAVAAVLAAVAGTVAVATYQHSKDVQARAEYSAHLPYGAGLIETNENSAFRDVTSMRELLSKELPVNVRADVDRLVVGRPGCSSYSSSPDCGRAEIIIPKEQRCPLYTAENGPSSFTPEQRRELRNDWRCADEPFGIRAPLVVADEKLLSVLAVEDPGAVAALKAGKAVSFKKQNVLADKVTVRLIMGRDEPVGGYAPGEPAPGQDKVFAAYQAPESAKGYGLELVLPASAAKGAAIETAPFGSYFTLDGGASSEQRQRLDGSLDKMGLDASVRIEKGYEGNDSLAMLALTVFAGLVTIGAAGIATGLAQADAEGDLKTLAAVGAPPRVRRTLSGFQCGVVALMGVVLGSAAGILPAVGLRLTERRAAADMIRTGIENGYTAASETVPYMPIAVPWATLAGLLVAVPLGAALLAALVTRSSGALARREV